MTTTTGPDQREHCKYCDRSTPHAVNIELRAEREDEENREFSREPYRVSTCQVCEATSSLRMNDA